MSETLSKPKLDGMVESSISRVLRARERANDWRAVRLEKGLCLKHAMSLTALPHRHVCRPDSPLRSPKTGDRLKKCFRCSGCGRCFHEGSVYHHISARKRRGIQEGPRGSLFNYDKPHPKHHGKFLSLCGECRKEKRGEWRYRNVSTWSGRCDFHRPLARVERATCRTLRAP